MGNSGVPGFLVSCLVLACLSTESSGKAGYDMSDSSWESRLYGTPAATTEAPLKPSFDNSTESTVLGAEKGSTVLPCRVRNVGDLTVSWVRKSDYHILTAGSQMYTNDVRYSIIHPKNSSDWMLKIGALRLDDEGVYECQISSLEGKLSRAVTLKIVTPEAFILGKRECYIDQGSTISLVCIIDKSPKPPDFVFWYHNDQMINYDQRPGMSVTIEKGLKTQSKLLISGAQPKDSGVYTCTATNTAPAKVQVFISDGENPAAITGGGISQTSSRFLCHFWLGIFNVFLPFLLCHRR